MLVSLEISKLKMWHTFGSRTLANGLSTSFAAAFTAAAAPCSEVCSSESMEVVVAERDKADE